MVLQFFVAQVKQFSGFRDTACLEAVHEPALPLLRRAMRERIGYDVAARSLLQLIVADLIRRVQRRFDVASVKEMKTLLPVMRPDAGEKVGLQLEAHRHAIVLRLGRVQARFIDALGITEESLHVMAYL